MSLRRSRRRPMSTRGLTLAIIAGVAFLAPMLAYAQTAGPTVEQLQKEIQERDAVIHDLLHRVAKLERQMATGTPPGAAKGAAASQTALTGQLEGPPLLRPSLAPATPPPPRVEPTQESQAQKAPKPAPGQFEVDEQAAERALERTLTATGALLVPEGYAEVEPAFSYTRREIPNLVPFNVNRNEFAASLTARIGLPWESQLEIAAPYNVVEQQITDNVVSPAQLVSNRTGHAFGDLVVDIAKTLLRERGWLPDLIGRIAYEIPTGPNSNDEVGLPNSHENRLTFSFTGLKRQDPLAFVAGLSYTHSFEENGVRPGDQLGFQTGVFLATSPETTLRAVLQQNFAQDVRLNDVTIEGSKTVQTLMTFGASSILGRGILLDLQAGIGLTRDAPDYTVILSLPIRFGLAQL
jgi:hypothetical protein